MSRAGQEIRRAATVIQNTTSKILDKNGAYSEYFVGIYYM